MRFFHITIANDDLDIENMKRLVGEDFGRYFVKGEHIFTPFLKRDTGKVQPTNRWSYSDETKSNNINPRLSVFLKTIMAKKELVDYIDKFGALVEIVTYFEDKKSRHLITISKENIELLSKMNVKLQVVPVDW